MRRDVLSAGESWRAMGGVRTAVTLWGRSPSPDIAAQRMRRAGSVSSGQECRVEVVSWWEGAERAECQTVRAHRAYSRLERVRRCRTRVYASRPCPSTSTIQCPPEPRHGPAPTVCGATTREGVLDLWARTRIATTAAGILVVYWYRLSLCLRHFGHDSLSISFCVLVQVFFLSYD